MRIFWIALAFVLIGIVGYAYNKNPDGCMKVARDFRDLCISLSPVKIEIKNGTATIAANTSTTDGLLADTNTAPADTNAAPAAASSPAPASPPATVFDANTLIPSLVSGKLIANGGSPYTFPAAAPLSGVHYFAIYYSAAWCPPCHAFTPELVQWYNSFKPSHPGFELIFVSEDHDANAQLGYMKEMNMPWPAVGFDQLKHDGNGTFKGSGIEQFAGDGIPDLVLVDPNGKVLLDTYQNGTYAGPEQVMNAIPAQVGN